MVSLQVPVSGASVQRTATSRVGACQHAVGDSKTRNHNICRHKSLTLNTFAFIHWNLQQAFKIFIHWQHRTQSARESMSPFQVHIYTYGRKSRRLLTVVARLLVRAVATLGGRVAFQSPIQTAAVCAGELLCCARIAALLSCLTQKWGRRSEVHNLLPSILFLVLTHQINKVVDTN